MYYLYGKIKRKKDEWVINQGAEIPNNFGWCASSPKQIIWVLFLT